MFQLFFNLITCLQLMQKQNQLGMGTAFRLFLAVHLEAISTVSVGKKDRHFNEARFLNHSITPSISQAEGMLADFDRTCGTLDYG